jgi:hypothetical protein
MFLKGRTELRKVDSVSRSKVKKEYESIEKMAQKMMRGKVAPSTMPTLVHVGRHITNIWASWVRSKFVRNTLFHGCILFKHECHALFKHGSHVHDFHV